MEIIENALKEHLKVTIAMAELPPIIAAAAEKISQSFSAGGKLLLMGNGGSAADAQHIAAELVGRFFVERQAFPAIALTTDSSILTCLSNDYDYSIIFSRQVEALCQANDVVLAISTSGNSENILKAVRAAKARSAFTIGLTGAKGGALDSLVDLCIKIPSMSIPRIQEGHIFVGHVICEQVERMMVARTTENTSAALAVGAV